MNGTLRIIAILFSLIGLLAAGVGLALAANTIRFRSSAARAEGVVTDLAHRNGMARAVVEFVDTKGAKHELVSSVETNPPAYAIGEHVHVYYPVERPEQARVDALFESWGASVFCGLFAAIFGGIGGGMLLGSIRRARLTAELRASGNRIQGKLVAVEYDTSLTVNGRSPWVLAVQWLNPATGEVYVFHSDRMWFDPSPYLNGEVVDVLIDPSNPRRHWVDTAFLPKQAS